MSGLKICVIGGGSAYTPELIEGIIKRKTEAFVEYADLASRRLGNRVKHWMTLSEPHISAILGYLEGCHAPGHSDLDVEVIMG